MSHDTNELIVRTVSLERKLIRGAKQLNAAGVLLETWLVFDDKNYCKL